MSAEPMIEPSDLKAVAMDFLGKIVAGQISEAYALYVSPTFRHHNPHFHGDAESLKIGMQQSEQENPQKRFEIQRVLQDGNLVAVHSRLRLASMNQDMAVVHLFRFQHGRIEEFWDVCQIEPIPLKNEHGMF